MCYATRKGAPTIAYPASRPPSSQAPRRTDMTISMLYFAVIRELVGQSEATLTLPADVTTVGELAAHLEHLVPALGGRLGAVRWAQNEELVPLSSPLHEGDVIAIIPPVAGG
jgi:molybdopterin converting factor subunit 1